MSLRKIIRLLLLGFVSVSFVALVYKEVRTIYARQNMAMNGSKIEDVSASTSSIPATKVSNPLSLPVSNITSSTDADPTSPPTTRADTGWVSVYYFHGTVRCTACINVEFYTSEVLETYFSNELQNGRLQFVTFNTDELQNQHYIKDFQLVSNSLVLAHYKGNKLIKYKNLADVWEYERNKEKCLSYIKTEIEQFLQEAK